MKNVFIFKVGELSIRKKLTSMYGPLAKVIPSAERLKGERLSKEDVVVVAGNNAYPRMIEILLGCSIAFLSFYDPSDCCVQPFTRFGHAVFLPMDATIEEIALAMEEVNRICAALGTVEDEIIGSSPQMLRLREQIRCMIAKKTIPVHLEGETGTGKSAVAQLIHDGRYQKKKKLVRDVASFYRGELCENRMFGNKRGAYTGAESNRNGIFPSANGSELFMDELQDLPIESQAMMMDVIETGNYRHQGDDIMRKTEFVMMTASNVPIKTLLAEKKFRDDLWYRMNSYIISIAPLRDHPEDIPLLVAHWEFLHSIDVDRSVMGSPELMERKWYGNVRELFTSLSRIHENLEDVNGNQL